MTVNKFVGIKRRELTEFKRYWFRYMREENSNYPGNLEIGEWEEKFGTFCFLTLDKVPKK